jgi:hypothetical protein
MNGWDVDKRVVESPDTDPGYLAWVRETVTQLTTRALTPPDRWAMGAVRGDVGVLVSQVRDEYRRAVEGNAPDKYAHPMASLALTSTGHTPPPDPDWQPSAIIQRRHKKSSEAVKQRAKRGHIRKQEVPGRHPRYSGADAAAIWGPPCR